MVLLSILTLAVIFISSMTPVSAFSNGQDAMVELGQPGDANPFDSGDANSHGVSERSLHGPYDLAFDSTGNLWVADSINHRILMYPKNELGTSGSNATVVIGQNDFKTNMPGVTILGTIAQSTTASGTSASTLAGPMGIAFDSVGNLWVADTYQKRILMFPKTGDTISHTATKVLGESDFTSSVTTSPVNIFNQPTGIAFDPSKNLWVPDMGLSDVKMFPKTGDAISSNFVTDMLGPGVTRTITASNVNQPQDIAFDSTGNLWVSDTGDNRVLMFPKTGDTISHTATKVLGQSGFITDAFGTTASAFNRPYGIAFDSTGNLWVADLGNNRVLMFPKTGDTISSTATLVLGQPDFITLRFGPSVSTLSGPTAIAFDCTGNLWVADADNNRMLMYASGAPVPIHCLESQHLTPSVNPNLVEFDHCVVNSHLICKIDLNAFREVIPCYDQVDGPLCPLPKLTTKNTLLEIQQEFPPLQQIKAGIDSKNIVAAKGQVLIMNNHWTYPVSVTQPTAEILMNRDAGWNHYP